MVVEMPIGRDLCTVSFVVRIFTFETALPPLLFLTDRVWNTFRNFKFLAGSTHLEDLRLEGTDDDDGGSS